MHPRLNSHLWPHFAISPRTQLLSLSHTLSPQLPQNQPRFQLWGNPRHPTDIRFVLVIAAIQYLKRTTYPPLLFCTGTVSLWDVSISPELGSHCVFQAHVISKQCSKMIPALGSLLNTPGLLDEAITIITTWQKRMESALISCTGGIQPSEEIAVKCIRGTRTVLA